MLEPPKVIPAEVDARIAAIDTETARAQGRLAALSLGGYLAFVPIMMWSGVQRYGVVAGFAALAIASALQVYGLTRSDHNSTRGIYVNVCINAALIGLVTYMVGPLVVAPTLTATTLMAYAAHPRFGRISIVGAILAASVAVPWALELAGVTPSTYAFEDGAIVLRSSVFAWRSAPTQLAFALLLVALLTVVAVLSRMMADRQREASLRLELQAWQVRQLVPAAPPAVAGPAGATAGDGAAGSQRWRGGDPGTGRPG
jgi:serine/threonine-protein kinase